MQIKIEIDVKPDELRRFLGLPDISGLQDDIIGFLRDKVEAAGEFHPTDFVRSNLDALRKTSAWRNIMSRVRVPETPGAKTPTAAAAAASAPAPKARSKRSSTRKGGASARAARKTAGAAPATAEGAAAPESLDAAGPAAHSSENAGAPNEKGS